MMFSACVAAVKSRLLLQQCLVIFFWSSVIMVCILFASCVFRLKLCFREAPHTHNIIVIMNIDSIKLTVYIFATNLTNILINIKFICTSKNIEKEWIPLYDDRIK